MALRMFKGICLTLFYIIPVAHGVVRPCSSDLSVVAVSINNVQTKDIQPGLTRRLIVNCSVSGETLEWIHIESITLLHNEKQVAKIDSRKTIYGEGTGAISVGGDSLLAKQWDFPDSDNEGKYECRIKGTTSYAPSHECKGESQINASPRKKVNNCEVSLQTEVLSANTNSKTESIESGVTKTLLVHCSVDVKNRNNSKDVNYIALYQKTDLAAPEEVLVAFIQKGSTLEHPSKSGNVSYNLEEGYLSVVWTNPNHENAGLYTCNTSLNLQSRLKDYCRASASIYTDEVNCFPNVSVLALSTNNVQTQNIQPGLTRRLIVNCTVSGRTADLWINITSITLFHNKKQVAKIDSYNKIDGEGTGIISVGSVSYLAKQWDFPDSDNEGEFLCETYGDTRLSTRLNCKGQGKIISSPKERTDKCTTKVKIEALSRKTNSKTEKIEVELTKRLMVHCSVDVKNEYDSKDVTFISLHHATDASKTIGTLVTSIQNGSMHPAKSGVVSYNLDEGYLSVVWNNPNSRHAGKYTCQAKLRLKSGKIKTCQARDKIFADNPETCNTSVKISAKLDNKPPFEHSTDQIIRPNITKKLIVKCSLNIAKVKELDTLKTLKLNFDDNKGSTKKLLYEINADTPVDKRFGVISNTDISFLNYEHLFPTMANKGTYTCEAIAKSVDGTEKTCLVSLNINAVPKEKCQTSISVTILPILADIKPYKNKPNLIVPGSTEKLMINCTFYYHVAQTLPSLKTLTLYKTVDKKLKQVAWIYHNEKNPKIKDPDANVKAVFNPTGESYLAVEWTNPGQKMARKYECEAVGGSHSKKNFDTCTSSVVINAPNLPSKSTNQRERFIENIHVDDAVK